ncbi:MAG TPA: arginine deiminase-related protein [Terriglobales bacterium]|nr:arginine deiminase-related protein [Terriglobales bacterium]
MSRDAVLLCPPTYFEVRDRKNPYMRAAIDRDKAQRQWEELSVALQQVGLQVETIDPVRNLEDMVFAANPIFVGHHPRVGSFVVPSEMKYPSRQREVPHYVEWFRQRDYKVMAVDLRGECLEGHGDLLWHPDGSRIWAGYGFRSTLAGIEKFAAAMQELGVPVNRLRLVDEYCYHLDAALSILNTEAAIVYPNAFAPEGLQQLREGWKRLYDLPREDVTRFLCNGIVANGFCIVPHLSKNLADILQQERLTPLVVNLSEFEKSGGGPFCMKNFL